MIISKGDISGPMEAENPVLKSAIIITISNDFPIAICFSTDYLLWLPHVRISNVTWMPYIVVMKVSIHIKSK